MDRTKNIVVITAGVLVSIVCGVLIAGWVKPLYDVYAARAERASFEAAWEACATEAKARWTYDNLIESQTEHCRRKLTRGN